MPFKLRPKMRYITKPSTGNSSSTSTQAIDLTGLRFSLSTTPITVSTLRKYKVIKTL